MKKKKKKSPKRRVLSKTIRKVGIMKSTLNKMQPDSLKLARISTMAARKSQTKQRLTMTNPRDSLHMPKPNQSSTISIDVKAPTTKNLNEPAVKYVTRDVVESDVLSEDFSMRSEILSASEVQRK